MISKRDELVLKYTLLLDNDQFKTFDIQKALFEFADELQFPEPEGMDDVFSKICELISIGQKGEAKKIFKQAFFTRSEGWSDEDWM